MRTLLAATLLVSLLAGCNDDAPPAAATPSDEPIQMVRDLPANLTATESVLAGADVLPVTEFCEAPTAQCFKFEFTINASRLPDGVSDEEAVGRNQTDAPSVHVSATLIWATPANDFDLYLFSGANELASDIGIPPATSAHLEANLKEGTYHVVVLPYSVAQDTFDLVVGFT